MSDNYVLAYAENEGLAIRTVVAEESSTANSTDVITATTDGKLAVRTVVAGGGSGGDYLPQYSTMPAITEADTGKIVQYVGETTETYTKGGIYEAFPAGMTITNSDDIPPYTEYFDVTALDLDALQTFCENNIPSIIIGDEVALQGDLPEHAAVNISYIDGTWSGNPPTLHLQIANPATWEYYYNNNDVTIDTDLETTINNMGITAEGYELDDSHLIGFEYLYYATGVWNPVSLSANAVTSVNGNKGDVWLSALDIGATMKFTETVTLLAANWVSDAQTVSSIYASPDNTIIVSPAPASSADYASAGIVCSQQNYSSLTFTCDTTPSSDITVNVLVLA